MGLISDKIDAAFPTLTDGERAKIVAELRKIRITPSDVKNATSELEGGKARLHLDVEETRCRRYQIIFDRASGEIEFSRSKRIQ